MPSAPTWLRGRDVSSVILTGQTEDAAGLFADGSSPAAQTITTSLLSFEPVFSPNQSEAGPITATVDNNIIESENNSFRISILLNGSGVVNPLATLGYTYDTIKLVAVRKRSGATTTPTNARWTFYGRRGEFGETIDSRGRNVAFMNITQIDIGSANPTYE